MRDDYVYRIPLWYLADTGLVKVSVKIDLKVVCTPEANMKELFKSNKKVRTVGYPDPKNNLPQGFICWIGQIRLDGIFEKYLESLILKQILRMSIQKTTYQKSYELSVGTQSSTINLSPANRQFIWLETPLV